MTLLVDTSVWSLALRRDHPPERPEVRALAAALGGRELVATTGVILQEVLQGAVAPRSRALILERFGALELLMPSREDHVSAADTRNTCRGSGIQIGTIDALIISIAARHDATVLSTDNDFRLAAAVVPFRLWTAPGAAGA